MKKTFSTWRWNPVRGEYESGAKPAATGTGEISAIESFRNCTMLLMGGTGFVGKVFLAMVLDRFPEIKHLIVQVRRKKNVSGEQRFFSEILTSPPVRAAVEHMGGEDAVRRKVTVIEGDLDEPLCGIEPGRIEQLKGKVDVLVNLAGVVDFDPPVNESVEPNVYGTQHLIELVKCSTRNSSMFRPVTSPASATDAFPKTRPSTGTFPCAIHRLAGTSLSLKNWSGMNNS